VISESKDDDSYHINSTKETDDQNAKSYSKFTFEENDFVSLLEPTENYYS
jgi:hypothetical protein